ncbi:MAG: zinc-finger-containing protein [Ramlibacter sp.]
MSDTVLCPYCHQPAVFMDSARVYGGRSYGMIWRCDPCDAHISADKNGGPAGLMANRELRGLRKTLGGEIAGLARKLGSFPKAAEHCAKLLQISDPDKASARHLNIEQTRWLLTALQGSPIGAPPATQDRQEGQEEPDEGGVLSVQPAGLGARLRAAARLRRAFAGNTDCAERIAAERDMASRQLAAGELSPSEFMERLQRLQARTRALRVPAPA